MKKFFYALILMAFVFAGFNSFAGGLPEDDNDMKREMASTQNELDKQRQRADDLEKKLDDLNSRLNDVAAKEPVERVVKTESNIEELPIHGYIATTYSEVDLDAYPGSFDQEVLGFTYDYTLDDNYKVFANIEYLHGSEIAVDLDEVYGVGEINIVEALIEWSAIEDKMAFSFGKFCTPFNTWCARENPASTISIYSPILVDSGITPATMTGIREAGKISLGNIALIQAIAVGNGKGLRQDSLDGNTDKALSARLGLEIPVGTDENNALEVGTSGFVGRDDSDGNDYQQKAWGLDGILDIGSVTLRSEATKSRINVDDFIPGMEEGHIWQDSWFIQASYNFLEKWDTFYRHDVADLDTRVINDGDMRINSLGLSYRPIQQVIFKTQYDRIQTDEDAIGAYEVASAQVAADF
ncbi:MAG: hypothetical protein ACD_79C00540G0001 [uncultured bacterium]|nr:MAG: hypothetical protein ACD_79C00540G0001 [uncultured bacterium]